MDKINMHVGKWGTQPPFNLILAIPAIIWQTFSLIINGWPFVCCYLLVLSYCSLGRLHSFSSEQCFSEQKKLKLLQKLCNAVQQFPPLTYCPFILRGRMFSGSHNTDIFWLQYIAKLILLLLLLISFYDDFKTSILSQI